MSGILGPGKSPDLDIASGGAWSVRVDADHFDDLFGVPIYKGTLWPVAARAVHERSALEQIEHNLRIALSSRDVIGQAKAS